MGKLNINFKKPLKRPPFQPVWHTNSAPVKAPGNMSITKEDTTAIISLVGSDEDDSEDDTPLKKQDSTLSEGTMYKLDRINKFNKQTVPSLFKGLCYNNFMCNKICRNDRCRYQHSLRDQFYRNCPSSNVTKEEIEKALSYASGIPSFYTQVFPVFAAFLGLLNDKDGLIYLVDEIFKPNFPIKEVVALTTVLNSLKQTNIGTLKDSIEFVLMQVAFNTSLGVAAFEIFISLEDLPSCWTNMRLLIKAGVILNKDLATKFLTNLVKTPEGSKICPDVYALYLRYRFFELEAINSKIRDKFYLLSGKSDSNMSNVALEKNTRNNGVNLGSSVPEFNLPSTSSNPPMRHQNATNNIDFASLRRGKELVFDAPHFNRDDRVYGPKQHGLHNNVNERQSNFFRHSSSDYNASKSIDDLHTTIPSGNKFPDRSGLIDNREGSHYDRINDYVPQLKRDHQQPQPRNAQFDRFSRNDSEPPRKKFQLNPGRLTFGTQNNTTVNMELDEIVEQMPVARPGQDHEYSKPPDKPVFGKLCFNPGYKFDVSLHNLYVPIIGKRAIHKEDIFLINVALLSGSGNDFLRLFEKYKDPLTIENFISMTLAHLKCCELAVERVWMRVLESIGRVMPNFYCSNQIRATLEVINMNLFFVLIKLNLFSGAKDILMKFTDWDSLVTSKLLIIDPVAHISLVGRYLFIAKLIYPTKPELCMEILTCSDLKLLEDSSMWPYHDKELISLTLSHDLKRRNRLLTQFLQKSYLDNFQLVADLYKIALSRESGIWKFDMIPYINKMFASLLAEKKITALKNIYNESNFIFEHIDLDILKQFLIVMFSQLPESDGFRIFDKCASHSLYKPICVNDALQENITVNTTYSNIEIEIIVKYCFHKLMEIRFLPANGFRFWIQFTTNPEETTRIADEALRKRQAISKVKNKVIEILQEFFQILGRTTPDWSMVEVAKEDLISFLERH